MDSLEKKIEKLESENSRKSQDIEIIQSIASQINSTLNLDQMLEIILSSLDETFGFKHSMILLHEEEEDALSVYASHGYDELGIGAKVPMGIGVIGTVARRRKLMRMNRIQYQRYYAQSIKTQVQKDKGQPDLPENKVDLPGLPNVESQLAIPLVIQDRLVGVFNVESPVLNAFNLLDESLLTILGSQAAGAIDNARLYELEGKRVKELSELSASLEDKVEERTRQLEEARLNSEQANQAKSEFLASMSHELRTPLNAILGFSQVLQEQYFGDLNEKQAEYVNDVLESGQHLLSLINDILDLSKIEAGKMELEPSQIIIKDLLEGSLVMVKEKTLAHGISLDIVTSENLEGLEITADERKVKQIMFNLLSNAAKFTPDGGTITVDGKLEKKELVVSVTDSGIGIPAEEQDKIFDEFYQTAASMNNKTPGTGLGLPLTKGIVEMHGGRIWVESDGLEKGSRFTFSIPLEN